MDRIKISAPLDKPPSWVVAGLAGFVIGCAVLCSALHWEHEAAWFSFVPSIADQVEEALAVGAGLGCAVVSASVIFQYFERDVPERAIQMPTRDEFMQKIERIEKSERDRR